ncbi:MAG: hypothetical protein ACRDT0_11700 [Pseudonocardiaceae bacterium]
MQRRSRYHESSALMPSLLAEVHTAAVLAPAGAASERTHHLLATLYGCVVICLPAPAGLAAGQPGRRGCPVLR